MARLFQAQGPKETMDEVIASIRKGLGVDAVSKDGKKGKDTGMTQLELTSTTKKSVDNALPASLGNNSTPEALQEEMVGEEDEEEEEEEFKGFSDDSDDENDDVDSFASDDYAQYDDRLASSEEDEEERGSILGKAAELQLKNELMASLHTSDTPSDSSSPSLSPSPPPEKIRRSRTGKDLPESSTFLPSLTMAAYWSGSESEPSDIEEELAPRKNRRGQKARQAIWERKHGVTAKHLVNPKKTSKNDGWDAKRGAVSSEDRFNRRSREKKDSHSVETSVAPKKPPPGKKDDEGPLHPSWEAAKKAKEQKVIPKFQGKKITFD
jgi:hypothetical protein